MSGRRRALVGLLAVTAAMVTPLSSDAATAPPWQTKARTLAAGVEHVELVRKGPDPLVVNVARATAGGEVELRAVLAHDVVGPPAEGDDRETTSSMCGRLGGAACINGDFATCYSCGEPFGGVVDRGQVLRSFRAGHEQLSLVGGRFSAEPQQWEGRLVATYRWQGLLSGREVTNTLGLDGLNVDPVFDGAVLYTSRWGTTTPIVGGVHLRVATAEPVAPGTAEATPVALHRDVEQVEIGNEVIVSADGAKADEASRFWDEWSSSDADQKQLALVTELRLPASVSVGGHPRLLDGGERLPLNDADPKVRDRHPRTLVGWNDGGQMFLVTVDGRQSRSSGVTLHEAADLLLELGATSGLNLDGGGSTTFVARCEGGLCVANRPSGGGERPVPVALALVAPDAAPVPVAASESAAPPAPPAPDPASEPPAPPPPRPRRTPRPPSPPPPPAEPVAVEPAPAPEPAPEPPPYPGHPPHVRRQLELALARAAADASPASPPMTRKLPIPAVGLALLLVAGTSTGTFRRIRNR